MSLIQVVDSEVGGFLAEGSLGKGTKYVILAKWSIPVLPLEGGSQETKSKNSSLKAPERDRA